MSRALIMIASDLDRKKAIAWIARAPINTRIEFKSARRSTNQNDLMWVRLTAIAEQLAWHGQKYPADDWKDYMMHALKKARWMPAEYGGMVPIGMRTSDLTCEEMNDLLALIDEFAARNGVVFPDANARTGA